MARSIPAATPTAAIPQGVPVTQPTNRQEALDASMAAASAVLHDKPEYVEEPKDQKELGIHLRWAAQYGHLHVIDILLQAGTNINSGDKAGHTALYFANKHNFPEISQFLTENGGVEKVVAPPPPFLRKRQELAAAQAANPRPA